MNGETGQWHIRQEPKPMNRDRGLLPLVYDSLIRTHPPPYVYNVAPSSSMVHCHLFSFPAWNCTPFSAHFQLFLRFIPKTQTWVQS